ncbi:hypothetical protein Cfor_05643, partial [Coptotermes formosanus]
LYISVGTEFRRAEGSLWVQLVQPLTESEKTPAYHYNARQETSKNDGREVLYSFTGDIC